MKKLTYLLSLISICLYGQTKEYSVSIEDKKEISSFYKFDNNSIIVCASKKSNGSKGNDPNLVKLNSDLQEVYDITFEGFDYFFDHSNDGAMLNNYHFIPRSTSKIGKYHFINKNGEIFEVEKKIISGGSDIEQSKRFVLTADKRINSDNVQFIIGNTQYALGRKSGKENKKEEYSSDDIYLSKLNLETSKSTLSNSNSEEIAASLSFRRAHVYYLKNNDNSYSLLYKDNRERLFSDISVITYDLDGNKTKKIKVVTDLEEGKHFGNTETIYDKNEDTYYTYGLYHEHKDPNRKLAVSKYKGYYIQKFDSTGKLIWKIQKTFLTDSFDSNQSQQDCIYNLDIIGNNKLLFSTGSTDEEGFDEIIIDKQTGKIDAEELIQCNRSTNGFMKNPLIIEQLSLPKTYGKNNFFNTTGIHLLSLNDAFSTYVKQLKDSKNKLHFKAVTMEDGFVVLQSDLKNNEHKLIKFNW